MVMMDLKEKETPSEESSENKKCCTDCKTTKTPLWRGGPAGPKTLCNACGIRYRKRRASAVGLNKGQDRKRYRAPSSSGVAATAVTMTTASTVTSFAKGVGVSGSDLNESLRMNIVGLGEEVLLQRIPSVLKKQRCQRMRKLGEEEQAAFCLMALSCGFVFA